MQFAQSRGLKCPSYNDIDLLLIGKTGNGKSATGNTILDRLAFQSEPSCESVTKEIEYEVCEHKNRKIKVVDGPGIGDTHHIDDIEKATQLVMDKMQDAVTLNPDGYHAFLLVIKFGNRLTAEDKECIRILKAIFGDSFIKNYCILTVTNGDNFAKLKKRTGTTFSKWCLKQEGIFKELFLECSRRAVLFDNTGEDPKARTKQMKKLIQTVDDLQHKGRRYSNEHFQMAFASRDQLMTKVKEPKIRLDALEKISLFIERKKKVRLKELEGQLEELKNLKSDVEELQRKLKEQDSQSGMLQELMTSVDILLNGLDDNIHQITDLRRDNEILSKRKEEARQMFSERSGIDDHMRSQLEIILFEQGNYNEEITKFEESIQQEESQEEEEFRFVEQKLKKEITKEKGKLKKLARSEIDKLDELIVDNEISELEKGKMQDQKVKINSELEQKLNELEVKLKFEKECILKEKETVFGKLQEKRKTLEDKKLKIREDAIKNMTEKFANERQQEIMERIRQIESLVKDFDQKMQAISTSSSNKDNEVMDMYSELKENYVNDLKETKVKPSGSCSLM